MCVCEFGRETKEDIDGGYNCVCKNVGGRERGRQRGEVESECVRMWEGERGRHIGG
jgi:hypothetical protein